MAKYYTPNLLTFEFQKPVISKGDNTPPVSPVTGDRYLVGASPTGVWLGQGENIAMWDGTQYLFTIKAEGIKVWVKDQDKFYSYNGTAWVADVDVNTAELVANKSTNVVTDGASDTKYPSVKAVKTYADGLVAGLLDDRGSYDASVNTFPASGGSGSAGAIMKGDIWYISVAGTLGGSAVTVNGTKIASIVFNTSFVNIPRMFMSLSNTSITNSYVVTPSPLGFTIVFQNNWTGWMEWIAIERA